MERRFARDNGSLLAIYAFIREFFAANGIDSGRAWDVDLIAEELFTNVIKYGAASPTPVALELTWAAPTLTLRLRDPAGGAFDPTQAPAVDITMPLQERRAGGLGLHLVRKMTDHMAFIRDPDGSTITVTKKLVGDV